MRAGGGGAILGFGQCPLVAVHQLNNDSFLCLVHRPHRPPTPWHPCLYWPGSSWSPGTVTDEIPINGTYAFPVGSCDPATLNVSTLSQFFKDLYVLQYRLPFLHWDVNTDDSLLQVHNCQSMVVNLEYNFKERGLFQVETRLVMPLPSVGRCH